MMLKRNKYFNKLLLKLFIFSELLNNFLGCNNCCKKGFSTRFLLNFGCGCSPSIGYATEECNIATKNREYPFHLPVKLRTHRSFPMRTRNSRSVIKVVLFLCLVLRWFHVQSISFL